MGVLGVVLVSGDWLNLVYQPIAWRALVDQFSLNTALGKIVIQS
jgi:hypothetical protein